MSICSPYPDSFFNEFYSLSRSKTVNENLRISAALLSRFDLIFILLDKPDEERDQMLSEHVMAVSQIVIHLLVN